MATGGEVLSHWYTLLDDFRTEPLAFYTAVEAALKKREIPNIRFERGGVEGGRALSASRQYLRVVRGRHTFDICAAPFGKSFFFSWWLTASVAGLGFGFAVAGFIATVLFIWLMCNTFGLFAGFAISILLGPVALYALGYLIHEHVIDGEDLVIATPVLGRIYESLFHPHTYFRHDSALMFQESVRKVVTEVINSLCTEQGLRALSDEEVVPRLRQLAA